MKIENLLSGFLRWGSLAAVCLCAVGMVMLVATDGLPQHGQLSGLSGVDYGADLPHAAWVTLAGLMSLVLVSVGRLVLCAGWFLRDGDRRFAAISVVTVLLVMAAAVFRLA